MIGSDLFSHENDISSLRTPSFPKEEIKKCHICGTTSKVILQNFQFEKCRHFYCVYCLFRTIFNNNVKEIIEDNEIIVKCKCTEGKKKLSLNEIDKIIRSKSEFDDNNEVKYNLNCQVHSTFSDLFCKECEKYICIHCKNESEHKNHKIVPVSLYVRMYKDFIKGMPLKFKYSENFKLQLDKSVDKFSKDLTEKTNSVIGSIVHIIEELNTIKNNYLFKLREIQENGLESINIIKSLFFEYYDDLSNLEDNNDIFSLRYLANLKSEINDFEMIFSMGIFNRFEEIENQINKFKGFTDNPYSLKVNFLEIPTTFREVTRTLGHDDSINCLSKIGDNQFISGSKDNSIKFWNLDDVELIPYEKFDKCTGKVELVLLLKNNHLCSSSVDPISVRIFEKIKPLSNKEEENISDDQYKVLVTLSEHKKPVTSIIELDNQLLVTAARDGLVILWEIIGKSPKIYEQKEICTDGVYSLCNLKNNRFASGDADGNIILWKENNIQKNQEEKNNKYDCYQILNEKENKNKIRCLILLNNNYLCSGDDKGNISLFNKVNNEKYEYYWSEKMEDEFVTCLASLKNGYLISGSLNINNYKVFLKVWEPKDKGFEIKETITKHNKTIKSIIELDWGNIVSAGDDGLIIIWKSGVLVD